MRFLPRVSLKVGLGNSVASVGAIITILYTPLLMFKQVQDLHLLVLLLVSFLVISFGMAAIIGLHMAERVRTLRWAAQEIAAGHLGTHVTVSWRDELSDLAAAFNRMSEEVERLTPG
jgi:nitrogen fixation/metabolism regulation signal transduction histidine kinase